MTDTSILPLSLAQSDFSFPGRNVNASIRFKGALSVPAIGRALAFIMRRHEGLRMRLVHSNGRRRQRITEAIDSFDIPLIRVDGLAAAEARVRACLRNRTDLENEGPLHAELLRLGPDDHVLLLAVHAIAVDAHALRLLLTELLVSYDSYARDREPALPPALRYTDYVLGEARRGERLSEVQVQYWRSVLSGSRDPILKREGRPRRSVGTWSVTASSITSAETERVQEFASAADVSMAAALYCVIFLSLSARYWVDDIIATVSYPCRDSRPLKTLVAKTTRLFPLRVVVNGRISLSDFAKKMQSAYMCGAIASRAPFTAARAAAQIVGGRSHEPTGEQERDRRGIRLLIAEQQMPRRELDLAMPHLSAERLLLGRRPYEGCALDGLSSLGHDLLTISIVRDMTMKTRRPVIFAGGFHANVVDEHEVRQLLASAWVIARMTCKENLNLTLGELLSRAASSRKRQLWRAEA